MKKEYTTPRLLVHGSVEAITLQKGCRGNDGKGMGKRLGGRFPCTS